MKIKNDRKTPLVLYLKRKFMRNFIKKKYCGIMEFVFNFIQLLSE